MKYTYRTRGVCATTINFELEDGIVSDVSFVGGCNGNTKAVAKLVAGKPVDEIVSLLAGNQCGPRGTSCADQMTIALRQAQQAARELHAS